jgi:hypothetical protein
MKMVDMDKILNKMEKDRKYFENEIIFSKN